MYYSLFAVALSLTVIWIVHANIPVLTASDTVITQNQEEEHRKERKIQGRTLHRKERKQVCPKPGQDLMTSPLWRKESELSGYVAPEPIAVRNGHWKIKVKELLPKLLNPENTRTKAKNVNEFSCSIAGDLMDIQRVLGNIRKRSRTNTEDVVTGEIFKELDDYSTGYKIAQKLNVSELNGGGNEKHLVWSEGVYSLLASEIQTLLFVMTMAGGKYRSEVLDKFASIDRALAIIVQIILKCPTPNPKCE